MQTARTEPAEPAEHPETAQRWVHSMIDGSAALPASQVGGKAWNLAGLADAGALVPPWVVIPAWVFDRFAAAAVSSRGGAADCASALQILQETPLPARLTTAVLAALDTAGVHGEVAVRSSAVEEDGARASFAGQFDSMLGVQLIDEAEALWTAVRQVWASAYGHRAAAYRLHHGAPLQGPSGMGVVVQQLVSPSVSGVAFTADPVTGDPDVVVVSSVFGLGDGLVSGELDADTFRVRFRGDRPVLVERTIATKERAVRSVSGGGTALLPVAIELRNLPSLRDEQALAVAREARRLADALGSPQDVEWALLPPIGGGRTGGAFVALQARPITTSVSSAHLTSREPSSQPPPRTGSATRLWENSNLIESYGGMTSPMTFSFARRAYEGVYREFARTMGVPRALLQTNQPLFASMLGYVRGRVYYNLFNWYRTLRLLPAYSLNREFLDGMLGVDDSTLEPYVILDIYSRYVVGWMVADRENSALAGRLIQQSCLKHGVQPRVLTLHSDRGAPTSQCTAQLLATSATRSLSRSGLGCSVLRGSVQDRTIPRFPDGSETEAKTFCRSFFRWYNRISMLTPEQVHLAAWLWPTSPSAHRSGAFADWCDRLCLPSPPSAWPPSSRTSSWSATGSSRRGCSLGGGRPSSTTSSP